MSDRYKAALFCVALVAATLLFASGASDLVSFNGLKAQQAQLARMVLFKMPAPLAKAPYVEGSLPPDLAGEYRPEPVPPVPHRLMAEVDTLLPLRLSRSGRAAIQRLQPFIGDRSRHAERDHTGHYEKTS